MTATTRATGRSELVEEAPGRPRRFVPLDALRGLAVVVLLTAMHPGPRGAFPAPYQHPTWHGLSFIDLFFPVFLFAVGASIPFSSRGESVRAVVRRAAKLALLGIVVGSFVQGELWLAGVLQHIAIAYLVAWLVLRLPRPAQVVVAAGLLLGAWLAFVAFADGADPWSMDGGFAHEANRWVYGGFRTEGWPQSVVSAVNVLVGAWCGQLVATRRDPRRLVALLAASGVALAVAGLALRGWVPLNKKLWTPSYALVSAGASAAMFAGLAWVTEVRRRRSWVRPLVVLGSNAIGTYVVVILALHLVPGVRAPLDRAVGDVPPAVVTWGWAVAWLLLGWAVCRELHRRRLFLKI